MMYIWFTVLGWILTALAVIGNGLVVYLILTKPRLRTTANWFVLSLAVADFLTGIYFLPSHLTCLTWFTCEKSDKTILKRIRWFFLNASIACLCAMTVDRYLAISKPLKYLNLMKTNRVMYILTGAWITSFILNALPFTWIFSNASDEDKNLLNRIFLLGVLLLFEFLPCILLATATVHILVIVRRHLRQTAALYSQLNFNNPSAVNHRNRSSRDSSSAKVVAVVVTVFIMCFILDIYLTFCYWFDACTPPDALYFVNKLFLLTNATMNPVAYSFLKTDIKTEVKKIFRMQKVRTDEHNVRFLGTSRVSSGAAGKSNQATTSDEI